MFGSNLGGFGSFVHKEKLVSVVSFNEPIPSVFHLLGDILGAIIISGGLGKEQRNH